MKPSYPACYNSIEALVLDSPDCNSLFFYPEGRAQNLRSLTILNNFAISTFVHTIACNPNLTHTLQNLTIVRPWTTHRSDIERTRDFIRGSEALKKLELVLTGSPADGDDWTEEELYANLEPVTLYLGLHAYLPPTLEYLALRIPTTRVSRVDIQKWLERARDSAWLPNLKEIGLSLNADGGVPHIGKEQEKELNKIVEVFMDVMSKRGVELVEVRDNQEMKYPLSFSL
ncbi:hypothetical protein NMY22_g19343 [Coprinellus aureogranulatus]|nr:hypothetical protein NMY22_g19343 [Coprinellus aureogranulatus]